jgi:hypothetical protein
LQAIPPVLRRTVRCNEFYITVRPNGAMLPGSAVEFVGFDKRVTPMGVKRLMDQALQVASAHGDASGGGPVGGIAPVSGAGTARSGHGRGGRFRGGGGFRTGISPSQIIGKPVAEAVTGQSTTLPLEPFGF